MSVGILLLGMVFLKEVLRGLFISCSDQDYTQRQKTLIWNINLLLQGMDQLQVIKKISE